MKATTIALTAVATAGAVVAQPHKHQHAHLHEVVKRTQTETTFVSGPTAYVFTLDDKQLSVDEVCQGLAGNKLKLEGGVPQGLCQSSSASATSTTTSATTTSAAASSSAANGGAFYQKQDPNNGTASSQGSQWGGWNGGSSGGNGVDTPFPDGQLDCSNFPSSYGPVALNYLGMGGWSGLQKPTWGINAITNLVTGISGDTCTEGMMCSYACPPGYQKSQWPSTQGATGQSVGGIQCKGGKLHLTNPSLSSNLCIPGQGGVQATNKAGGVVAICRTDYPGTESETVPVQIQPGSTQPLTNPNAGTYYTWKGGATSAQYYLNPIGVSQEQGCQWGNAGSDMGNFAPINFGVGYKDGKTWLSIFQNKPTTLVKYQGTVELQGDLSATCKYQNGQYCGATGCNADGCTVAVNSGTATFVISQ